MYSTCIFCKQNLGRNEALAHFQVGRRLAFDAAKGRLWVVCGQCERWNLSPLDTRWEAIEEAERAFRATRLRVATDNIGMTQLSEGVQLVRVGAPPKLELAGWRYGDQFGRRRRKHLVIGSVTSVGAIGLLAAFGLPYLVPGVPALGGTAQLLFQLAHWIKQRRDRRVIRSTFRDAEDELRQLALEEIRAIALVAGAAESRWQLKVRLHESKKSQEGARTGRDRAVPKWLPVSFLLCGEAAHRALSTMLPLINAAGGSASTVRDAVSELDNASSLDALLRESATRRQFNNAIPGENLVAGLPPRVRLALEMILHENDERRALEGEMALLEERWREAEEIAAIADSLLQPPDVTDKLEALRRLAGKEPAEETFRADAAPQD